MHSLRYLAGLAVAAQLFSTSQAQGNGSQAPQPQATAQATDSTVLHTAANLVLVDVVVTDRDNPVHGLVRGRFHVFEDGHEQPIATFDERQPPLEIAPDSAIAPTPLPPHTYTNVPAYPPGSAVNVLLLDGLNTPLVNQMQVRLQMLQYLGKIEPGTQLAIFTLSSRLRMVEGFTSDVAGLARALKSGKAGPQTSVMLDPAGAQDVDSIVGFQATMGADPLAVSAMQQFQADLTSYQTDQRVSMTLNAMQQLARYLSGVPGRKNLIWFSGSFPLALDPDDSLESPFEAMRNYSGEIRDTDELLSAARVAVYPVDARGLMTLPSLDASYTPSTNLMGGGSSKRRGQTTSSNPMNSPNPGKDDINAMKQNMQEEATMEQVADQTGGREYMHTNGLKEAVASAIANGSSYYTIGYTPGAKPMDGQFRKIELHLDNANYKLAYRHGYYADPPDKASAHSPGATSLIVAATMHGAPLSTQILFQARVVASTDPSLEGTKVPVGPAGEMTVKAPLHRVVVDLKVDPHGLALNGAADGARHDKIEYTLVAYDAESRRVNYLDHGFQLNLSEAQYAHALTAGIPMRLALDLPAGPAWLRIAVHDMDAARAGSLEIPVTDAK